MKVCKTCGAKKAESEFSIIRHTRKNGNVYFYTQINCKDCIAARQSLLTKQKRSTKEGKDKHNQWAKEFHNRHRTKCLEKMKYRRGTPEYKSKMKTYRERNKDKIHKQEVVTKKRYQKKHVEQVTDEYIIRKLVDQEVATREMLLENPQLIEAKTNTIIN